MRILYWESSFWPRIGGAEVFGMELIRALRRRGHEFLVIASHWQKRNRLPDRMDFEGSPVLRFPIFQAVQNRDAALVGRVRRDIAAAVREWGADVIHINSADSSVFFLPGGRQGACFPTVVTVHSSATFGTDPDSLLGRMLGNASAVVGVSEAMSADAVRFVSAIAPRLVTILNALPAPAEASAGVDFAESGLIVAAGRIVKEKGFDVLLRAIALLRQENFPSVRLRLLGDGPELAALKQLAVELKISERVEFCGWVAPELVRTELGQASVVAMPSVWREPFGLVALQSAQAGRPLVASAVGGLPEIVRDGETGLLVPPGDAEALAAALGKLLAHPEEARRMGAAAARRAAEVFDFEKFVSAYENVLGRVARGEKLEGNGEGGGAR